MRLENMAQKYGATRRYDYERKLPSIILFGVGAG